MDRQVGSKGCADRLTGGRDKFTAQRVQVDPLDKLKRGPFGISVFGWGGEEMGRDVIAWVIEWNSQRKGMKRGTASLEGD